MTINQQPPTAVLKNHDGQVLQVHSIFRTIQGEGPFSGRRSLFLRLAHCQIQCPGCDTEYTHGAKWMHYQDLADEIVRQTSVRDDVLVITGGEPFRQNLWPMIRDLKWKRSELAIQIETNGAAMANKEDFVKLKNYVSIVVSPKTANILPMVAESALAFKYVVKEGSIREADGLPISALDNPLSHNRFVARCTSHDVPIYVQPMDTDDAEQYQRNIQQAVKSVMDYPGRRILNLQIHKICNLE